MLAIVFLALASCRSLPVAPSPSPLGRVGAESPASVEHHLRAEPPSIHDVRISRHGDAIDFTISLLPGSAAERLPLDAYPPVGTSWTFQMSLDIDQNPATGRYDGVEYELILLPGNVLTLRRESGAGSNEVTTVAFTAQPGRITFSIPASVVGDDDGLMDYVLRIYRVEVWSGEHDYLLAATLEGTNNALPDASRQVPVITDIRTEVGADTLYLRAQFLPRDQSYRTFYDPEKAGGWCLQLFLNTDQTRTGYWLGYDYIVRGVDRRPDGSFVTFRIAPVEQAWGPMTGAARFTLRQRNFELAVPLKAIGGDDGLLDYVLEQYATVECVGCSGGVSQGYFNDTFGSTGSPRGSRVTARGRLWPGKTTLHGSVLPGGLVPGRRVASVERRDLRAADQYPIE